MDQEYVHKSDIIIEDDDFVLTTPDFDFDDKQVIARSSFADMLYDYERNQKYFDALKQAIDEMHSLGKNAKVLDIGTGTGLLSMMAVKCGADSVIACEEVHSISACAQKVVNLNGFGDKIKIIPKHSTKLTVGENCDLPEKANILVAELFDTELIGEGALNSFCHAQNELLENECIVIPSYAIVYAQVIESSLVKDWNELKDFYSSNGNVLIKIPPIIKNCPGAAYVHDLQLSQLPITSFREIIKPQPVFHFNWSKIDSNQFSEQHLLKVKAECTGTAYAVFMWWELIMDPKKQITLSCAPYWAHPLKRTKPNLTSLDIPWRDHWMQAIYYLPKPVNVVKDQELFLISSHDEYSLWFNLDTNLLSETTYSKQICECDLHLSTIRASIGMLNDCSRNNKFISILKKYINNNTVILLLHDACYLGLVAEKLGAKKILCLNEYKLSRNLVKKLARFNNLNNVKIYKNFKQLQMSENIKDINLIFGYPPLSNSLFPHDSLSFTCLIDKIRNYLPETVAVFPKVISIKGMIVHFNDLHKIRTPLEGWEDFNLEPFSKLISEASSICDSYFEMQPLWEYPCMARSSVKEFSRLDIERMFLNECVTGELCFFLSGKPTYNALVMWPEWDLDGNEEHVICMGPISPPVIGQIVQWDMCTKQAVQFIPFKPQEILNCKFCFDIKNGKLKVSCS